MGTVHIWGSDFYCHLEQALGSLFTERGWSQHWNFLLPLICSRKPYFTVQMDRTKPKKMVPCDILFISYKYMDFSSSINMYVKNAILDLGKGLKG